MTIPSNAGVSAIGRLRFDTDGTGIRTLIAFAGCPLRCKYCPNPYTWQTPERSTLYTPEQLLEKVSVDSIYFKASGGGITFGGGEPLLHSEFISRFIDIAPKSWNFNIETSLAVPFEKIAPLTDKIQFFTIDIKTLDENIYRSYTEGDLSLAENNLHKLLGIVESDRITVRVPLIPEYTDTESQKETVHRLQIMGIKNVDAFKYQVPKQR